MSSAAPVRSTSVNDLPRRRGRRRLEDGPALNRERLIETLISIAANDGLAAINMRRVASDLGVSPRLIYHHVRDKEQMLAALFDALLERNMPDLRDDMPWDETLRVIAAASRRAYSPFPGVGAAILARTADSIEQPWAAALRRAVLASLAKAGLVGEQIEEAYLQFSIITLGSQVLAENGPADDERRFISHERVEHISERTLELLISDIRARA